MTGDRLARLEAYYDAVPRADAEVVDAPGFTIFAGPPDGPRYARPRLGRAAVTLGDVEEAVARQRSLGLDPGFEWVAEATPGLDDLVRQVGLAIDHCPLLVLDGPPLGAAASARLLDRDELGDYSLARAAVGVAFTAGGLATGREGIEARDAAATSVGPTRQSAFASGRFRMAAAYDPGGAPGPVGGGGHTPVGETSEITGVGVLPAYRHRGLAGALTYVLAQDALERGVTTVFCSAQNAEVARIYTRVGFRRVGTACIAEARAGGG